MARNDQSGFVLVATIWVLAIITIAASYFAERVSNSLSLASKKQDTAEQLVNFANTRADMLFRLATTRPSVRGLGIQTAIALDDRAYRGSGNDIVRLQDNRGLLNVNFVEPTIMSRFLGQMGVPVEKRDAMIDSLRDYIDVDNLRRLNGAEAPEYAALGLPPPPNDWLATPSQLKNIIGWRDQADLWEKKNLMKFVTTSRQVAFNANTAPLELLASLPGLSRESAAALVKVREEVPFQGTGQLGAYLEGSIEPDLFVFFPGMSFRITQQSGALPWVLQFSVTLTPNSEYAPWRVDYFGRSAVSYAVENEDKIPSLPAWAPPVPGGGEAP